MDVLIIIISIIMFATAIMMGLTVYGLFTDKDKDGIPDALEQKFSELKEEISKLKK
ncbi:MAG: hypothetical protein Tp1111SUR761211_11 [Prokaryotic dsDNA virus sp.]|nr:MAG: hypothetical protein Tp1111SUR761211_11 [Prokaryotic dsDNA virus sp.]|tara:strand:- start:1841 stop:2008 length:168 start_codon:yes stop_codon:yes gene_type:complete